MTETASVSVVDIVSEARYQAMFALRNLFKADDLTNLTGYMPVIAAMQGLPEPLVETVGIAIVSRFFEDENLDPTSSYGRSIAVPYASLLAANITSAAQAVYRQMQEEQAANTKATQRLMTGTLAR